MSDETKLLLKLTEENIRYKLAYQHLKSMMEKAKKDDRNFLLHDEEITEVLEIAGVIQKEVNLDILDAFWKENEK